MRHLPMQSPLGRQEAESPVPPAPEPWPAPDIPAPPAPGPLDAPLLPPNVGDVPVPNSAPPPDYERDRGIHADEPWTRA